MRKNSHSIRLKIVIWAVGLSLVLALFIATTSYILSMRYLKENQRQSALTNIHILGNDIDSAINTVMTFSNWICLDSTINNYVQYVDETYSEDKILGRKLSMLTWNHLNNEFNIVGVRNYVDRVVVSTVDGKNYLQDISGGGASSSSNTPQLIMASGFFEPLISSSSFRWYGICKNPMSKSGNPPIIPIIRAIYKADSSEVLGWVYMDIPVSVVIDSLKSFVFENDDALYLTFPEGVSYRYDGKSFIKESLPANLITYTLPETGWKLSYLPSVSALKARMKLYLALIMLIFTVILFAGIILSISLHRIITKPVAKLIHRLDQIGLGDFTRDPSIEWQNELGEIGIGINSLSQNVSDLMEKRILDEKTKHDLEYQVLQSQINPHFLYNTLNTIKWMATIQGSEGIADMSTALSRLMKNISKGTESVITLEDEFALVDDYFTIMKYRYGGTIELEYETEDEALLKCRINRFSLQPIIENSIFHGIEPKGSAGKIVVHTYQKDDKLFIDVTDNGVGMSKETIDDVLSGKAKSSNEFFKQIGVSSVNERIKYTFGEEYGMHITSEVGVFTTTTLILPLSNM